MTQSSHGGFRLYEGRPGVLPVDANEDDSSPTREYPEGSTWVDPDGTAFPVVSRCHFWGWSRCPASVVTPKFKCAILCDAAEF